MLVMTAESQEKSIVQCTTTKGPLLIEVNHAWSPLGAKRFMDLVRDGFYKNIAFFRCVEKFLTQFGISENPAMKHWHNDQIKDDPNLHLGIAFYCLFPSYSSQILYIICSLYRY